MVLMARWYCYPQHWLIQVYTSQKENLHYTEKGSLGTPKYCWSSSERTPRNLNNIKFQYLLYPETNIRDTRKLILYFLCVEVSFLKGKFVYYPCLWDTKMQLVDLGLWNNRIDSSYILNLWSITVTLQQRWKQSQLKTNIKIQTKNNLGFIEDKTS